MQGDQNFKELKTEDIILRIRDLRTTLIPVLNPSTMQLLEEVERRLGGGGPLTPFEQLSKSEQKLRKDYDEYKSFRAKFSRKYNFHSETETYEQWKISSAKSEKEDRKKSKEERDYLNSHFIFIVKSYLLKHDNRIEVDTNKKLMKRAFVVSESEIWQLGKNEKSRQILSDVLKITNFQNPSEEDKTRYWLITREEYEKGKDRREQAKADKGMR